MERRPTNCLVSTASSDWDPVFKLAWSFLADRKVRDVFAAPERWMHRTCCKWVVIEAKFQESFVRRTELVSLMKRHQRAEMGVLLGSKLPVIARAKANVLDKRWPSNCGHGERRLLRSVHGNENRVRVCVKVIRGIIDHKQRRGARALFQIRVELAPAGANEVPNAPRHCIETAILH